MKRNPHLTREEAILVFFHDHKVGTLSEISNATGYPEASVSCSLRTLRKPPHRKRVAKTWEPSHKVNLYYLE